MIGDKQTPACNGQGCSIKESCRRYMDTFDKNTVYHFPFAPIRYIEGKPICEFIIQFNEQIQTPDNS
jgi:hypothetical protein